MHDLTPAQSDPGPDPSQATDALLSEVAVALLRLPFEGRTRALHIRALQLKHRLGQWGPSTPPDDERRATRESILALRTMVMAEGGSGEPRSSARRERSFGERTTASVSLDERRAGV
jgi:hypothetical protein